MGQGIYVPVEWKYYIQAWKSQRKNSWPFWQIGMHKTCSCTHRDPTRDGWIKEFIKQKLSSGMFWAVGAAEKKTFQLPTAISMPLFGVVFSTFCGQKKF